MPLNTKIKNKKGREKTIVYIKKKIEASSRPSPIPHPKIRKNVGITQHSNKTKKPKKFLTPKVKTIKNNKTLNKGEITPENITIKEIKIVNNNNEKLNKSNE